ncbi:MAG: 5-formyltetrahydrofolate cyclo-ligase [Eubacterium sp.]
MQIKSELRRQVKSERKTVKDKQMKDMAIADTLQNFRYYNDAQTILCYVSLTDEIATDSIINQALIDNKRVAVPYCTDTSGHMDFYIIKSLNDLNIGSFNVREPDIIKCQRLEDYNNSVIIVPAICFDERGFRLGYGKGYYDRFLQNYPFISIGLCYNSLIKKKIPADEFDQSVDYIISESNIFDCTNGGENGKFRF